MAEIPGSPTVDAIYQLYVDKESKKPRREYLGGSEIGIECSRALWYSFRHAHHEKFEGRLLKLFDTGSREEGRIIADLRAIGCEVTNIDPSTGEQWRFKNCNGHFSIGLDGVLRGIKEAPKSWHTLECKTSNTKGFNSIKNEGCKKAKPVHYAQCQFGMGAAELDRCLYIVVCKDDDRIYLERIKFEPKTYKALLLKAGRIINAESAPERLNEDPSFWACKFCAHAGLCHGTVMPEYNCRTCVHSSPTADARWSCAHGLPMDPDCSEHLFIPSLLAFAEPVDGSPEWVEYKTKDGHRFVNCAGAKFPLDSDLPHYSSKELSCCHPSAVGHPAVEMARSVLGGEVVESRGA